MNRLILPILAIAFLAVSQVSAQQAATDTQTDGGATQVGSTADSIVTGPNADEVFDTTLNRAGQGGGTTGTSTAGGGRAGGGIGGLGGFGGLGGLFGNVFGQGGGAAASQARIRTRLRSAVVVSPIPPAQVQNNVRSSLRSLPTANRLPGVNVQMEGRTAVLSGTVRSDKDRRMSELLMRLEPGVSQVRNSLIVQP